MKTFMFDVIYNATITKKIFVEASTEDEAIERIKDNFYINDVIDSFTEINEIIDIIGL